MFGNDHFVLMNAIEKIRRLPDEVQNVLLRKSSKQPGTRFVHKLSVLLSFVQANPHSEDEIGVAWENEQIFRMKKNVLASLMQIKVNTLNVNLRDLSFKQVDSNKDGWSKWSKPGFTRSSLSKTNSDFEIRMNENTGFEAHHNDIFPSKSTVRLGCLADPFIHEFHQNCVSLWQKFINPSVYYAQFNDFLESAAIHFKLPDQSLDDAKTRIKLILPEKHQITISHFEQIMALFGPDSTFMQKLQNFFDTSKMLGPWINFESTQNINLDFYGYVDSKESNAIIIFNKGETSKIWNFPFLDSTQSYLIDENNVLYSSWTDYFNLHSYHK